jgi:DNA-binding Lrp family transcriptional regulator
LIFANIIDVWKFLESEKLVILGLTEDANRTDTEIADRFGMNKGTVAAVRRRLLDSGAIFYANIPSFSRLGCEMVACHIGTTSPAASADVKANDYLEFCNQSPHVFHGIIGGGTVILYTVLRNATDMDLFIQGHHRFFSGTKRSSRAQLETYYFPYELSRGTYATNFAPLVHRYFDMDTPAPAIRKAESLPIDPIDITENESSILMALVERPTDSDNELSKTVGLSRQAVTRIRHRLEENELYTRVCIPRVYKWGFEIYAVGRSQFSMDITWEKRIKGQPALLSEMAFMTFSKANESVSSFMVATFQDYADNAETLLAWYHKGGVFDEEPRITMLSLERCIELKNFDFVPALRHVLEGR